MPLADALKKTEPTFVGLLNVKVANRPCRFQRESEWAFSDTACREASNSANISAREFVRRKNTHRGLTNGQTSQAVEWGLL